MDNSNYDEVRNFLYAEARVLMQKKGRMLTMIYTRKWIIGLPSWMTMGNFYDPHRERFL